MQRFDKKEAADILDKYSKIMEFLDCNPLLYEYETALRCNSERPILTESRGYWIPRGITVLNLKICFPDKNDDIRMTGKMILRLLELLYKIVADDCIEIIPAAKSIHLEIIL